MEDRWPPTHRGRKLGFLSGRASGLAASAAPALLGSFEPYFLSEKAFLKLGFFSWDFFLYAGARFSTATSGSWT